MNMHPSLALSFSLLLALICGTASADNGFRERLYFGFGVTSSSLKLNDTNIASINNFNEAFALENNTLGGQAFLGLQFDQHVALEVGYTDIGTININDGNTIQNFMDVSSSYLDGVLTQSISDRFNLFAQAGISYWNTNNTLTDSAFEGTGVHYGAGMDINLFNNKDRMLRIKWENQTFDNVSIKSASSISASILFTF